MSKIKEGEYIRTKNGSIFKIIGGTPDDYDIDVSYYDLGKIEDDIFEDLTTFNYNDNGNFIRDITKTHSHNIIDLIEVGDYVNGTKVIKTFKDPFTKKKRLELEGIEINFQGDRSCVYCEAENIKSIVTKEQFERMEYKV